MSSHKRTASLNAPHHIAIIPDGNRRWAKKQKTGIPEGHRSGVDILMDILLAAIDFQIRVITFFGFSTENWQRDVEEVEALFALMEAYLAANCDLMVEKGIRFFAIGDLAKIPSFLQKRIEAVSLATEKCQKIDFVCALNYGARDEIVRACKGISEKVVRKELRLEEIDISLFSTELDTKRWPDPDLLIRTSGEFRLSNFLLWQLSYAELFISQKLWPDFMKEDLFEAIQFYQTRERRMGGT